MKTNFKNWFMNMLDNAVLWIEKDSTQENAKLQARYLSLRSACATCILLVMGLPSLLVDPSWRTVHQVLFILGLITLLADAYVFYYKRIPAIIPVIGLICAAFPCSTVLAFHNWNSLFVFYAIITPALGLVNLVILNSLSISTKNKEITSS